MALRAIKRWEFPNETEPSLKRQPFLYRQYAWVSGETLLSLIRRSANKPGLSKFDTTGSKHQHPEQQPSTSPSVNGHCSIRTLVIPNRQVNYFEAELGGAEAGRLVWHNPKQSFRQSR